MRNLLLRLGSVFMTLILGLASLALVTLSTAAPANAATAVPVVGMMLKGGPGHEKPVAAYVWELNGKRGPCIDFNQRTGDGKGTLAISHVPGMTVENSKRAFKLVQKYRNTRSNLTGAALALSIWSLRGDAKFRQWYKWAKRTNAVSPKLEKRVNQMLAESRSHGPYKVSVQLKPVLKGKTGVGKVTVLDSRGKAARGMPVHVSRTTKAAKIAKKAGKTGKKGIAKFKFTRTKNAKVGFKATVRGPSVEKALLSKPSAGNQRLLVGGFNGSWSGTAEYESSAGKPTFSTVCDTDCDGEATVTIKYCDTKKTAGPIRWVSLVGGKIVLKLDVGNNKCASDSVRLVDGNVLQTKYCLLNKVGGKCKGKYVKIKRTYEVVCPAWPEAVIKIACTCEPDASGSVTFAALVPGNPRHYTGYVVIDEGTVVRPAPLGSAPVTVDIGQIKSKTRIQVTFKVWRDAGKTMQIGGGVLQDITIN